MTRPWKMRRRLHEALARSERIQGAVQDVREGCEDFAFCDGDLVEYARWPDAGLAPTQPGRALAPPRAPSRYRDDEVRA